MTASQGPSSAGEIPAWDGIERRKAPGNVPPEFNRRQNPFTAQSTGALALEAQIDTDIDYIPEQQVFELAGLHEGTKREVMRLAHRCRDVRLRPIEDTYAFTAQDQLKIDREIEDFELEAATTRLFREPYKSALYDPERTYMPAVNDGKGAWGELRMHALALGPLYEPHAERLGVNTAKDAFDTPLFPATVDGVEVKLSANDVLTGSMRKRGRSEEEIESEKGRFQTFIERPIDEPSSRFFRGSIDGRSIRTRAVAATQMINEQLSIGSRADAQDLRSLSLACGAAAPVYQMVADERQHGRDFEKVTLVDIDPMALAAAHSSAPEFLQDKTEVHLRNLVSVASRGAVDLTEFIEPNSVDVVDILGLFEYFSPRMAVSLLQRAHDVVRPGGIIVLGNMLRHRPQQTFFSEVVQWPRVEQRSIAETLRIVEEAGFKKEQVSVVVPEKEGVYAVVGIRIPEGNVTNLHR